MAYTGGKAKTALAGKDKDEKSTAKISFSKQRLLTELIPL